VRCCPGRRGDVVAPKGALGTVVNVRGVNRNGNEEEICCQEEVPGEEEAGEETRQEEGGEEAS